MNRIDRSITLLSRYAKYISMFVQAVMMIFITISVIMRKFNHAVLGDYELVQLMLVVLVMLGLAYVQQINGHVSIGLIVDRFSKKTQRFFDGIAYLLIFFFCGLIGIINIQVAIDYFFTLRTTAILKVQLYPFVFLVGIGFIFWSLVALLNLVKVFRPTLEQE
ncbi:TRAP transporter small permease [Pueribacillus theae]|uniref:TRAP transporter small permease n=1 Tax=Pueribacillus theae TaxID=2171751 RepID=A0A2U1JZT2_9BACI|nr:TRAP transporter small permease [Pueribacillus theae]PWA10747.1 TRAP transporter small permease [Pueribacillus theae]